mmetsp:Transcript_10411/g.47797  ORF Transcript_10411/g.47797 Transcript_10411/m.47797 type:complete len:283 (-) Transcript_10411:641-1489(-)
MRSFCSLDFSSAASARCFIWSLSSSAESARLSAWDKACFSLVLSSAPIRFFARRSCETVMTRRAVALAARLDSFLANFSFASALSSASSHAAVARSAMPWSLCISPSAASARSIALTIFSVAPALDSRWNAMSALRVPVMARMSFSASMAAPASFLAFHSWSISSCTSSAWSFFIFSTFAAAASAAAFAAAVSSFALASPAATAAFSASHPLGISPSANASFRSSSSTLVLRSSRSDSAPSARFVHSSNLPGNGRRVMTSSVSRPDSVRASSVSFMRSAHSV